MEGLGGLATLAFPFLFVSLAFPFLFVSLAFPFLFVSFAFPPILLAPKIMPGFHQNP